MKKTPGCRTVEKYTSPEIGRDVQPVFIATRCRDVHPGSTSHAMSSSGPMNTCNCGHGPVVVMATVTWVRVVALATPARPLLTRAFPFLSSPSSTGRMIDRVFFQPPKTIS